MGEIFSAIDQKPDDRLIVGFDASDDGAVFQIDADRALVQSVDFFTPIVDDPEAFGAIAAANSLSDIYAMGGRPLTALSLVCYPYASLGTEILAAIVAGGSRKVRESGALVVGGHSVSDEEIKFGYSVTGEVAPNAAWRNDTPQVGDALVLSKPLGTGVITTAVKQDKLPEKLLDEPIAEMARLNSKAAELARAYDIHAATDITGFGLMGHLYEMLRAQNLGADIRTDNLAVFEGVMDGIAQKALTRAHRTNREYLADYDVPDTETLQRFGDVVYDPQTSGGLLFALPSDQADALFQDLERHGHRPSLVGTITSNPSIVCG